MRAHREGSSSPKYRFSHSRRMFNKLVLVHPEACRSVASALPPCAVAAFAVVVSPEIFGLQRSNEAWRRAATDEGRSET